MELTARHEERTPQKKTSAVLPVVRGRPHSQSSAEVRERIGGGCRGYKSMDHGNLH